MYYMTTGGRHIRIIGQSSVNRNVQFHGFSEVWSISIPYIYNCTIPDKNRGWDWNGIDGNSTSSTDTYIWGRTIDTSPDNPPSFPVFSCVIRSCNRNELLYCRRLERLWNLYNPSPDGYSWLVVHDDTRFYRRNQYRDFIFV